MTPKEKAQELYSKMLEWQDHADIYIDRKIISTSAKKCALIAVDEMILVLPFTDTPASLKYYTIHLKKYLQQVKQEIINL
jgi:hypothetical protein